MTWFTHYDHSRLIASSEKLNLIITTSNVFRFYNNIFYVINFLFCYQVVQFGSIKSSICIGHYNIAIFAYTLNFIDTNRFPQFTLLQNLPQLALILLIIYQVLLMFLLRLFNVRRSSMKSII